MIRGRLLQHSLNLFIFYECIAPCGIHGKSNLNVHVLISERVGLRVMHRVTIAGKHKPSKNPQ